MDLTQELSQELVGEFVQAAHFNFTKVCALHQQYPALINARWEQFNELAIEAAGHTGQRDIAEYLLTHGASLQIFVAAMLGMTEAVVTFLQADPTQANARGIHGISLFYHAALSGKVELLDLLRSYGGKEGMSEALHAATSFGQMPVVAWLLDHEVTDVNPLNFDRKTPLRVAREKGFEQIADLLLEHGATE